MKKAKFYTHIGNRKNGHKAELVDGYTFESGEFTNLGVYKTKYGLWYVVDTKAGLSICTGNTRKSAVETLQAGYVRDEYREFLKDGFENGASYDEIVKAFNGLIAEAERQAQ